MRTTVRLDPEVHAAAEHLHRERGIGLGEAVNELARAGLARQGVERTPFVQRTVPLGARIDISNIADVLEILDGAEESADS